MAGFSDWLAQFTQVNSALGDLARDAAADPYWPEGPDDLETYTDHLEGAGASEAALDVLSDAWARYTAGI
ncbi:YozE family protein [Streptomyces albidoflavus]